MMSATELQPVPSAASPALLPPKAMMSATGPARAEGAGAPAACPLRAAWEARSRRGIDPASSCARARKGD